MSPSEELKSTKTAHYKLYDFGPIFLGSYKLRNVWMFLNQIKKLN